MRNAPQNGGINNNNVLNNRERKINEEGRRK
jgi:hypothetical protein